MSMLVTQAILLRAHPYSETSRIFRFLTAERGLIGVLSRGARRGDAKGRGAIDIFDEGELVLYFRETRDLQTFKDFSVTASRRALASDVTRFAGASILAEVVLRHAGEEEASRLYSVVRRGLDEIAAAPAEELLPRILSEGWQVVSTLGYAPQLDECVACGASLPGEGEREEADSMGRFDFSAGGVRCARCGAEGAGPRVGPTARRQLMEMVAGGTPSDFAAPAAHLRLFGDFVTYHVSDARPLKSLHFLSDIIATGS